MIPSIIISNSFKESSYSDYSSTDTLFLSMSVGSQCDKPIVLNSYTDTKNYIFLQQDTTLTKAIKTYFKNGGKKVYILSMPWEDDILTNSAKFFEYIQQRCDNLYNIETISAVDLFDKHYALDIELIKKIQYTLSLYAQQSNKIFILDLPYENVDFITYSSLFHSGVCYYPQLISSSGVLPTSVYVSAMMSKVANETNIATAIANIELKDCTNFWIDVTNIQDNLYKSNINPIIYETNNGYRLWGVRSIDGDNINTIRIIKYIKRILSKNSKQYIFEPNTQHLKDKILRQTDNFLFYLYKIGVLKGDIKANAYKIVCDSTNNSQKDIDAGVLNIDIFVSVVKVLEYIHIRLNRVQNETNQASLNIS